MSGFVNSNPVRDNLLLSLDMGNIKNYPETGTSVTDSIGNLIFTLLASSYYTYSSGTIQFTRTTAPTAKDGGGLYRVMTSTNLLVSNFLYNDHTWEIWARIDDRTAGAYDGTENFSVLSVYSGYHAGFVYSSSKLGYYVWNGTSTGVEVCSWTLGTSGTQIIEGQWNQLVVTRSGNVFTPYKNGIALGTGSTSTPSSSGIGTGNGLFIGKTQTNAAGVGSFNYYSKSTFSAMRMYNRALSAEEVFRNFNSIRGRFGI